MDFIEKDTICNIELVKLKHLPTIKLGSYIYAYSNSDISFNICDYNGNLLYEDCLGVSKFGNYIILRNKDNLYGVLNEEGKLIVDFKYESIDYINNCSMFIYRQENYCYLVNESLEFVYKSSIINHIGDDLFICNNDKETFIIDNFGNKVVNLKKKSFLKNFSSKYKKYIIDNSIKKKVLNRTGKLIYKSKDYFVFLDENRILVHSNNKIKIHDLSKSKTFNIPNYYAYKDYCTNYVILKDKHNKTDCILNNNKYVYISSSKIKKVKITYIYNDLIYGTYEEDDVVKAFVSDINGRVIVKDVDQEYIVEDYILVVKDKKYGVLNLNGDILLNIEYDNIKYANGLFYVKSKDKFYVYNSDMKIIYSSKKEIEYVDSNNKFLVVLSNHRNILLTLNGDILISGIDDNIILINENKVIVGNSVVNLDSEYFNSAIDYQLIVNINNKAYLFHNDSKKKREKLKQGICSDISKIMDEYKLLDDSKKVYRKIDKNESNMCDNYKLITNKHIEKVIDDYLWVSNNRIECDYDIIDYNGNIIFSNVNMINRCSYVGNNIFKYDVLGIMDKYFIYDISSTTRTYLSDVKNVIIYDNFMNVSYKNYMVLMDYNLNIISNKYDSIMAFKNNHALVMKNKKYGLINSSGNEIAMPIYDEMLNLDDNYITLRIGNKFVIIDRFGNEVNDFIMNVSNIKYLSPNRYLVSGEKDYIIDSNKNVIYKSKRNEILVKIENEKTVLAINGKRKNNKLIDNDLIRKVSFLSLSKFYNNTAIAYYNGNYILVDKDYDRTTDNKFTLLEHFYGNLFLYKTNNNLYGIINDKGKTILPDIYISIKIVNDYIIVLDETEYKILDKDFKLKTTINKKYTIASIMDNLILIKIVDKKSSNTFFPKYYHKIIDFSGNEIIPFTLKEIFLMKDSRLIINNHLVDLNQEYLDLRMVDKSVDGNNEVSSLKIKRLKKYENRNK